MISSNSIVRFANCGSPEWRMSSKLHRSRTHLGLGKDTPDDRPVHAAETGHIVAIPEVGGLHHRYERRAA